MEPGIPLPHAADNASVLLWALGILLAVVLLLAKVLASKIDANERRCREENAEARAENAEARAEAKAAHAKIAEIQGGVIVEQQRTQDATNVALGDMADATRALTAEIHAGRAHRNGTSGLQRAIRGMDEA